MAAGMMIVLLADVHSNLPALRAVLSAIPAGSQILFAGDAVGYYTEPDACCALLREIGAVCVRGNHDAYVCGALAPNPRNISSYRLRETIADLSQSSMAWLCALPTEIHVAVKGVTVRVRHASPWDEVTYLHPDSPLDKLGVVVPEGDFLVLGHTHRPMSTSALGGGRVVNPGSVGQPRDGDPRPSFAVLDPTTGSLEFHRVDYDREKYQRHLRSAGVDDRAVAILGSPGAGAPV